MRFEKSCGAVVFTEVDGERKYVVIRSNGGDYGCPKGHMEAGETEEMTALREVREETGLAITLLEGFRQEEWYDLPNKPSVRKQVVYFLGKYQGQELKRQEAEISGIYLLPYGEAVERLTFGQMKEVLRNAEAFLM